MKSDATPDLSPPAPVGEFYVLGLLQLSSCFRGEVCHSLPCACARSLLDEIGKPLRAEIERLRGALDKLRRHVFIADEIDAALARKEE